MIFNLKDNRITKVEHALNDNKDDLIAWLKSNLKEPLLLAILDPNGRVNASEYPFDDLLLVNINQIYSISEKDKILQGLCRDNTVMCCKYCLKMCHTGNSHNVTSNIINSVTNNQIFNTAINALLDEAILENNFDTIHTILLHSPSLRLPKYLKILLKMNIANHCFNIRSLNLFEMNNENETIVISFFKTSEGYLHNAIRVIPGFMKTDRLYFAAFVVLLQAFTSKKTTSYVKLVARNTIQRFIAEFKLVINLILEYFIKVFLCTSNSNHISSDREYLNESLAPLADMFSIPIDSFISKNIYHIFNLFYPSPNFTQSFIENNIKYVVIQRILSQAYKEQVDDVDVFVGLLYNSGGGFNNFDLFFKPSVGMFIKKNLSHILFKIKNAYMQGIYNNGEYCIYKIMKFVLGQINLNLYFRYVWPYVEFFLNNEQCECSCYFLEWLRTFQNSKLMCPYLSVPFEKIEDIPDIPNLEMKKDSIRQHRPTAETMPIDTLLTIHSY